MYEKLNQDDKTTLLSLFQKELNSDESEWIKTKMEETFMIKDSMIYAKKLGMEQLEKKVM